MYVHMFHQDPIHNQLYQYYYIYYNMQLYALIFIRAAHCILRFDLTFVFYMAIYEVAF